MTYFHVFWPAPQLNPRQPPDDQEIFLWDFEALTWLLSALELRRHTAVQLITDSRGLRFVQGAGLGWVYSGGISTALNDIPRDIDPEIFWSAGKIVALRNMRPPCAWVDLDLVLRHPLDSRRPTTVLHWEDKEWPWYQADQTTFAGHGFPGDEWDWTMHPTNTGILQIADAGLLDLYTDKAIGFMTRYSKARRENQPGAKGEPLPGDPTVFAEQRVLPMCAAKLGLPIEVLTECGTPGLSLPRNPHCLHLWGTKAAYRACPEARVALVNHLRAEILERYPEATETLEQWDLGEPRRAAPLRPDEAREQARVNSTGLRFSLLQDIRGIVWIEDPNVGVRRRAGEGSMMWSGEIIRPEPGAAFELVVAGERPVRIEQSTLQLQNATSWTNPPAV